MSHPYEGILLMQHSADGTDVCAYNRRDGFVYRQNLPYAELVVPRCIRMDR